MLLDVDVKNPYVVALPIVNVDYDLTSNAKSFLSGAADIQGVIPARGSKTVSIPLELNYKGLKDVIQGIRPGSVIPYTADVGLSVKPPVMGNLRLPLKKEGELPIPAIPEVKVTDVTWEKPTLSGAGGVVKLGLVNRNEFPVEMSKMDYALSLGGMNVAESSIAKSLSIEPNGGTGSLEIPISVSLKDVGMGLLRMISGNGSDYGIKGSLDVNTPYGPMSLPIDGAGNTLFKK